MPSDAWDERTDNKLKGIGKSKNPPEVPREQEPGTQEDPDVRHKIVDGFYGPRVETVESLEEDDDAGGA